MVVWSLLGAAGTPLPVAGQDGAVEAVYTADGMSVVDGGIREEAGVLGNLDLTATLDLEGTLGWSGASVFAYVLANHGVEPSSYVGDLQAVNNIEAPDALRLYEAWLQQSLLDGRVSVLGGLYDVNSEFDIVPAAALFIHSSFGIGADFGLSGPHGPSIFPVTSLGLRVSGTPTATTFVRGAVLDGVPGDPDDPGSTAVRLDDGDGLLLAGEAGFYLGRSGSFGREEDRRRWLYHGRGVEAPPHRTKVAVGAWRYTTEQRAVAADGSPSRPGPRRSGNAGAYLLVEHRLHAETDDPAQGLAGFLRLGVADEAFNPFGTYTGGGLTYVGLLPARPADAVGVGVAVGWTSDGYEEARAAEGLATEASEIAFELTYRAPVLAWLDVQGDLQYVRNPSADPGVRDAVVAGVRIQAGL